MIPSKAGVVVARENGDMDWTFTDLLRRFDGPGGWYYVDVPPAIGDDFEHGGFIPVTAQVSDSRWDTSVMPKGNGERFVAVKAAVRRANHLDEGDPVTVTICRR